MDELTMFAELRPDDTLSETDLDELRAELFPGIDRETRMTSEQQHDRHADAQTGVVIGMEPPARRQPPSRVAFAAAVVTLVGLAGLWAIAARDDGSTPTVPASQPPRVTPTNELPLILPQVPPDTTVTPQPRPTRTELDAATAGFDDRRTIALELAPDGTPLWWATTWTETLDRGPDIVCLGSWTWVSCDGESDLDLEGQAVKVISSGDVPNNGAILLLDAGVANLAVTLPGVDSRVLSSVDLGTATGRSVAGFGIPENVTYATISGTLNGKSFEQVVEFAEPPPLFQIEGSDVPAQRLIPDIATIEHRPLELP